MGRLIDAENLSKNIAKWCMGGDPQETEMVNLDEILIQVVDEIEKQPTAYDVEKVVEQIQKKHYERYRNILDILGAVVYCKEQKCQIEELCETVRKGGVE